MSALFEVVISAIWKMMVANFHKLVANSIMGKITTFLGSFTEDEIMHRKSVIYYIVDSSVMDFWDDFVENTVCPFYHPLGFLMQALPPFFQFFWAFFGKSPVFWIICSLWAYNSYRHLLPFGRRAPLPAPEDARTPAAEAPAPTENAPVDNQAENAPTPQNSPVPSEYALAQGGAAPILNGEAPTLNGGGPVLGGPTLNGNGPVLNGNGPIVNGNAATPAESV